MSDRMIIENSKVTIETEEGARSEHPESLLVEMLRKETLRLLGGSFFPTALNLWNGVILSCWSFTNTPLMSAGSFGLMSGVL